jgi:hypothetical protein
MNLGPRELNTPPGSRRALVTDGRSVNSTGDDDFTDLKFENSSMNGLKQNGSARGISRDDS